MCCTEWNFVGFPDHQEFVLVAIGLEVWPAYWDEPMLQWVFNDGAPAHTVDAWMEIPEHPDKEN